MEVCDNILYAFICILLIIVVLLTIKRKYNLTFTITKKSEQFTEDATTKSSTNNNTIKEKKPKKGKKGKKGKKKKMNVETESNIIEKKPAYKRATTDIGLELLSNQEIKQNDTIKDTTSNIKETEFSTNPK